MSNWYLAAYTNDRRPIIVGRADSKDDVLMVAYDLLRAGRDEVYILDRNKRERGNAWLDCGALDYYWSSKAGLSWSDASTATGPEVTR